MVALRAATMGLETANGNYPGSLTVDDKLENDYPCLRQRRHCAETPKTPFPAWLMSLC
jgi:hypothetical protein